jgi:hypothetical protein
MKFFGNNQPNEMDEINFETLKSDNKIVRLLSHPHLFVWKVLMGQIDEEKV